MMTILLILGIIILLLWIIWLVLSGGDEMPTVKTFKKSSKHSNTSQLKAEAKFDCQCGEKNIKLKNNGESIFANVESSIGSTVMLKWK